LNLWASELPDDEGKQLVRRVHKGSNDDYRAAFCELTVHALFRRTGAHIEVHPTRPGTANKPDFLITSTPSNKLYLEVATFRRETADLALENRAAPFSTL
jgi:hypothetical protein